MILDKGFIKSTDINPKVKLITNFKRIESQILTNQTIMNITDLPLFAADYYKDETELRPNFRHFSPFPSFSLPLRKRGIE